MIKPLQIAIFGLNLRKKEVSMDQTQNEKQFVLVEITKVDHQLSKKFYFIKISYFLTEL